MSANANQGAKKTKAKEKTPTAKKRIIQSEKNDSSINLLNQKSGRLSVL
jgi:hypothetical protein